MTQKSDWFKHWFDTDYYHTLYDNRDYNEAEFFMKNLVNHLGINKGSHILDLCCGKGRHSNFLNSNGFKVTGVDLSKNSIKLAKQNQAENLEYLVHDMRDEFPSKYSAVFNLFTSFGYFEDDKEDLLVLKNIKNSLLPGGVAVIDFLNIEQVKNKLISEETIIKGDICFNISRYIKDGFIQKEISFSHNDKEHKYIEKVKCIDLNKIEMYMAKTGLKIDKIFGNYNLDPFNVNESQRLIIIAS